MKTRGKTEKIFVIREEDRHFDEANTTVENQTDMVDFAELLVVLAAGCIQHPLHIKRIFYCKRMG